MTPTGKCKKDFEKWYWDFTLRHKQIKVDSLPPKNWHKLLANEFYQKPFSMQYGVLVDFFDSVKFFITNEWIDEYCITIENREYLTEDENYKEIDVSGKTRQEAREQAITKADEIYNKSNN